MYTDPDGHMWKWLETGVNNLKKNTNSISKAVQSKTSEYSNNLKVNSKKVYNGLKEGVKDPKYALIGVGSSFLNGGIEVTKYTTSALAGVAGKQYANAAWSDLSNAQDKINKKIESSVSNKNVYNSYKFVSDVAQTAAAAKGLSSGVGSIKNIGKAGESAEFAGVGGYTSKIAEEESRLSNVSKAVSKEADSMSEGVNNAGKWNKGSFDDAADSLEYHFKKHGNELGAKDVDQYLRKAEEFAKDLKGATKKQIGGSTSDITRYYKNGKYIDIASDKTIISFGKK